jgi:hypothetical protein
VSLALSQPHLPSCGDCEVYVYDLKTGRKVTKYGRPAKWQKGQQPPCHTCPKVAIGDPPTPAGGRKSELTPANERAYAHYRECRAVGRFPEDSRVYRNADIIRQIEDAVAQNREGGLQAAITAVMAASLSGGKGAKR